MFLHTNSKRLAWCLVLSLHVYMLEYTVLLFRVWPAAEHLEKHVICTSAPLGVLVTAKLQLGHYH